LKKLKELSKAETLVENKSINGYNNHRTKEGMEDE